ncbi:MAG TPA: glycosyltransferase 87 family protein, partial [Gaiellaceae bacterium]|nr:glycosyltransferase 87 family protein [Gaiellaceae bacterium]
ASWSRLASAALGVVLFLLVWGLLHHGFYARNDIVDTPVYQRYGESMTDGRMPYRDFRVEYPPGALPVFVLPALGAGGSERYRHRFEGLLVSLGVACVLLVAAIAPSLWAPLYVAAAPLALGSVYLSRFDLWPVTLTLVALVFLVFGRFRLGLGSLGLATAAKVFPAVILPIALAHVWRLRGRRETFACAGTYVAVVAAAFLPFAIVSPGGLWDSLWAQASRPLQIESLGSGLMLAVHQLFGLDLTLDESHGSQNLAGSGAEVIAVASTVLQVAVLLAIWLWYARGPASRDRLLAASAAAVCAFVTLGKVLSPQFLIWLIPLVPLVRGRRGLGASGLLAVALVLTQLWFPFRYWRLALEFDAAASWLVLARDLTLVALLVVLMSAVRREPARSE